MNFDFNTLFNILASVVVRIQNNADEQFEITVNTILDICHRAWDVFKSSKTERKHRIIKMLFSNLLMDGKKLVFSIRKPFNLIVESGENLVWLQELGKFRTSEDNDIAECEQYFQTNRIREDFGLQMAA